MTWAAATKSSIAPAPRTPKYTVPITATPSDMPSCWTDWSTPDAEPTSWSADVAEHDVEQRHEHHPRPMPATVSGAMKSHAPIAGARRLEDGEQPGQAHGHEQQPRLDHLAAQLVHRHPADRRAGERAERERGDGEAASIGVQPSPTCMRMPSVIPMPAITLMNTTAKPRPDT